MTGSISVTLTALVVGVARAGHIKVTALGRRTP